MKMTIFLFFFILIFSVAFVSLTSIVKANPIFTETLQTANTRNLDDTYMLPISGIDGGSDNSFSIETDPETYDSYNIYTKWSLIQELNRVTILDANYSLFYFTGAGSPDANDIFNCTLYHVYSFPIFNISEVEWKEETMNGSNQPNKSNEYNITSSFNLTFIPNEVGTNKWINFNATHIFQTEINNLNNNVTLRLNCYNTSSDEQIISSFYSKEATVDTTLRPKVTISYQDFYLPSFSSLANNGTNTRFNDTLNFTVTVINNKHDVSFFNTHYILSQNDSGIFRNFSSIKSASSSTDIYNINYTYKVNATRGKYVCGVFYANDTSNNWNNSAESCFTVANTAPKFNHTLQQFKISHNVNVSYDINCSDVDSDTLNYTSNSTLFTINNTFGNFSINPDKKNASSRFINITCGDDQLNVSSFMWFNITDSAPNTPTLQYPSHLATISTTYTTLNWTTLDPDNDWINYYVYADTNANPITLVFSGTNASGTNMFFNYTSLLDATTYYWKVQADDNVTNSSNSTIRSFAVNTNSPAITIIYPTNNSWRIDDTHLTINFTATDTDGIGQCELWLNETGIWHKNQTNNQVTSGIQTNFSNINLTDERYYLFSINCSDTPGASGFYSFGNVTFGIDTIKPTILVTSPTEDQSLTSKDNITLIHTANDGFLNNCSYNVIQNATGLLEISNTTITCNQNINFSVTALTDYMLTFYANDSAGNTISTFINFTVTTVSSDGGSTTVSGGGGGGSTLAPEKIVERKVEIAVERCGNLFCEECDDSSPEGCEDENPLSCPIDCRFFSLDEAFCTPIFNCGNWLKSWFLNGIIILVIGSLVLTQYMAKQKKVKRL